MQQKATFAAGCFWGVEDRFRNMDGVYDAVSGYTGGHIEQPSYRQVCSGDTGHAEAVEVIYDPSKINYIQLLDAFWGMHNPTQKNRQGVDVGSQYRSVIFYHDDEQRALAEQSRHALNASGRWSQPIVTEIEPAVTFWRAEDYHQRYLEKNGASCSIG